MSKLLQGLTFALLIEGVQGYGPPNPLAFLYNATYLAFATDATDNSSSKTVAHNWQLFTSMADKILTGQFGNITQIVEYIPGLKNLWQAKPCAQSFYLQSNISIIVAADFVQKFAEEFKNDELYKNALCTGLSSSQIAFLVLGGIVVLATFTFFVGVFACKAWEKHKERQQYNQVNEAVALGVINGFMKR